LFNKVKAGLPGRNRLGNVDGTQEIGFNIAVCEFGLETAAGQVLYWIPACGLVGEAEIASSA
jgi:hypothetical protein